MLSIFSWLKGNCEGTIACICAMGEADVHVVGLSALVRANPMVQGILKTELVSTNE